MSQWALYLSGGTPFGGCATTFPPKRGHHGCWEVCHIHPIKKRRRKAPHHNLLNPPAEGGQNPLNPLNPGRLWRPLWPLNL